MTRRSVEVPFAAAASTASNALANAKVPVAAHQA